MRNCRAGGTRALIYNEPGACCFGLSWSSVTDTGERKTLYGYPARHLKAKVEVKSSDNACTQVNQQYELDGWYADVSKDMAAACQQFLPPGFSFLGHSIQSSLNSKTWTRNSFLRAEAIDVAVV